MWHAALCHLVSEGSKGTPHEGIELQVNYFMTVALSNCQGRERKHATIGEKVQKSANQKRASCG
ncbi:hypothetical protein [Pseudomonas phage PARCL1pr]|nr:hypothetical protein [Pseudomonas phage PARCL1pr]